MAKKEQYPEDLLIYYTTQLQQEYDRWDHVHKNGANDPSFHDGANLSLIRNHIIHYKNKIHMIIKQGREYPSLFPLEYPDIYSRPIPPTVPLEYMAKANEIRTHAASQLELYEQDHNFCYIRDNALKAYPYGIKCNLQLGRLNVAPSDILGYSRYRHSVEQDNLLAMRDLFREPYAEKANKWAYIALALHSVLDPEKDLQTYEVLPNNVCSAARATQNTHAQEKEKEI